MSLYHNKFMDYYNFLFTDLAGNWLIWILFIYFDLIFGSGRKRSIRMSECWGRQHHIIAIVIAIDRCVRIYSCLFFVSSFTDPRTNHWPLISSPFPTLTILIAYHYFVRSWGPRYMANRKPYKLENVLLVYNFVQVLVSVFLFYEVMWANGSYFVHFWWNDHSNRRVWKVRGCVITAGGVNQWTHLPAQMACA